MYVGTADTKKLIPELLHNTHPTSKPRAEILTVSRVLLVGIE